MKTKASLLMILLFPLFVISQTVIEEGNVSGNWAVADSPFLIEGDITIAAIDTLVIEPGVVVEFQNYFGLFVKGRLWAIGNETDSIKFTVDDTTGYYNHSHPGWKGIRITDVYISDSSHLSYCIIEYGKGFDGFGGGLAITHANNVSVTNSVVQYCYVDKGDYSYGGGMSIAGCCPFLRDVLIKDNHSDEFGGGICISTDSVDARGITITNNYARLNGGGIYSINGSETLHDFVVSGNYAETGGGIWSDSETKIIDFEIFGNEAKEGGGIYIEEKTEVYFTSVYSNQAVDGAGAYINSGTYVKSKISDCNFYQNHADAKGGGVRLSSCHAILENTTFNDNDAKQGGGIYMNSISNKLIGLTVKNNDAYYGGGMYIRPSYPYTLIMDTINLCSIYNNNGKVGKDLFSEDKEMQIIVDTFTVQNPSDYYAMPAKYFSFDIVHGLSSLVNEDFYISPDGSDQNSGLNENDPFKTINHALSILYTDPQNPATIHLENGIYSPSLTGEIFPLTTLENLSVQGSSNTILNADSSDRVLYSNSANGQYFKNLNIENGKSPDHGGGVYSKNSHAQFDSINITNCKSGIVGGGWYSVNDSVQLTNINVSNCGAISGGGMFFEYSDFNLSNSDIHENIAENMGGGVFLRACECQMSLNQVRIYNNQASKGGGVLTSYDPILSGVSVFHNTASVYGGGIYNYSGAVIFDTTVRSSIYANSASIGNDLYNQQNSIVHVIVDTFSVLHPTAWYADPIQFFDFDILNGIVDQIDGDIYVSTDGDNNNSGLSWDEPLQTIRCSLSRAASDELNPVTVHLAPGVYSPTITEEYFPIQPIDYFRLLGENEVILDAETQASVIVIKNKNEVVIENLQIQNGHATDGGGVNIQNSQTLLKNLNIVSNTSSYSGGGLYLENSQVTLSDLFIKNNASLNYHGVIQIINSEVDIFNTTIDSNQAVDFGGIVASFSELNIVGSQISNNSGGTFTSGLGLYYTKANIVNTTFSGNLADDYWRGSIFAYDSVDLNLMNCIFWDDLENWDVIVQGDDYQSKIAISNSSLTKGESSIGTNGNVVVEYDVSNISGDPVFTGEGLFPYQISEFSPCINMGNPDTTGLFLPSSDLAGNPRIYNGCVDMGAFEWGPFVGLRNHTYQNIDVEIYPNPFVVSTTIAYHLKEDCYVSIQMFNSNGKLVSEPINQRQVKGWHQVQWDAKQKNGIYFCRVQIDEEVLLQKVVRIR